MDEMLKQFTTQDQLTEYCNAQYQTILDLSRKIQKLEEEKSHLELVLASSTPILSSDKLPMIGTAIPNEQIIAEVQLFRLRQKSDLAELTLEETKKVEAFSKVLAALRVNADDKPKDVEVKAMSTEELMKAINGSTE